MVGSRLVRTDEGLGYCFGFSLSMMAVSSAGAMDRRVLCLELVAVVCAWSLEPYMFVV